ncbi:MAG: DUF1330 domain-containing protein [Pseudomonadota bacterium]
MGKGVLVSLGVVDPDEKEAFDVYAQSAPPLLLAIGGRPVGRYRFVEPIAGGAFPGTVFAMEFDDIDRLKGVFESDEYKALIPYRDAAFKSLTLFIAEAF